MHKLLAAVKPSAQSVLTVLACLFAGVAAATAQDSGATIAASAAVMNLDSRSEWSISGAAGYRFNRSVGLEIEVTAVPRLKAAYPAGQISIQGYPFGAPRGAIVGSGGAIAPGGAIAIFPGPTYTNPNGRAVFFTNNIRVEIPTALARLTPYFVGGGGVATVRQTADLTVPIAILPPIPVIGGVAGTPIVGGVSPTPINGGIGGFRTTTYPVSVSSTGLALTLGGGVAVAVMSRVSIDADLRFFRIFGNTDTNAGRFGVAVRYRF